MIDRITESEITFTHSFVLNSLVKPLQAGTYRLIVDEELIEGFGRLAYRRVDTHIEIPALSVAAGMRQRLRVTAAEIDAALSRDAQLSQSCSFN